MTKDFSQMEDSNPSSNLSIHDVLQSPVRRTVLLGLGALAGFGLAGCAGTREGGAAASRALGFKPVAASGVEKVSCSTARAAKGVASASVATSARRRRDEGQRRRVFISVDFGSMKGDGRMSSPPFQRRRPPPPPPPERAPPPLLRAPALGDGRLALLDAELRLEAPRELSMLVWRPES